MTLETGNVVALSGNRTPSLNASIPERWNGSAWTALTGANQSLPLYPRAFVEPKYGHVFVAVKDGSHPQSQRHRLLGSSARKAAV